MNPKSWWQACGISKGGAWHCSDAKDLPHAHAKPWTPHPVMVYVTLAIQPPPSFSLESPRRQKRKHQPQTRRNFSLRHILPMQPKSIAPAGMICRLSVGGKQ